MSLMEKQNLGKCVRDILVRLVLEKEEREEGGGRRRG